MCPTDQASHEAPKLFEEFMKKGVGFFIVAVLTSFSITGVIEYIQVNSDKILILIYNPFLENLACKYIISSVFYIFKHVLNTLHIYDNQTFHWTWMCENEDDQMVLVIRMISAAITMLIWLSWVSDVFEIGIVQVEEIEYVRHNGGISVIKIYILMN